MLIGLFFYIAIFFFVEYEFAHRRAHVAHVYFHVALVAIEGDNGELVGSVGEFYAWNVAIAVERQIHLACGVAFDVVGEHLYF